MEPSRSGLERLAKDQRVSDIPCLAGNYTFDKFGAVFDSRGTLYRFGLATAHEFFGLRFPRGMTVRRGGAKEPWHFLLPADAGVHTPTPAPAGVTPMFASDGQLAGIDPGTARRSWSATCR